MFTHKSLKTFGAMVVLTTAILTTGCGSRNMSFDLLAESATFNQSSAEVNGKIDVLWVIDNSGSMDTSQQAIASNFRRFIEKFHANGYDFQIAVTTSDAYKDDFNPTLGLSIYRNGTYVDDGGATVTAPKILTKETPNLEKAFIANILRGISGSGDERTFSSMRAALANTINQGSGFPRSDAFLSVIMLSDEDDFSWSGTSSKENLYNDPAMHTLESYVSFLDTLTASNSSNRRYNVNSIAILDETCRASLGGGGRKVAIRQNGLANMTGGILGSLCADFGTTLSTISNKIIELSTQFYLDRKPQDGSLRVFVSNFEVPLNAENGYSYNSEKNSITFHGTSVPAAGAQITVSFDPTELR